MIRYNLLRPHLVSLKSQHFSVLAAAALLTTEPAKVTFIIIHHHFQQQDHLKANLQLAAATDL